MLRAIQALPSRSGQRTAALIGQALTLLSAMAATRDDLLRFNSLPLPVINCRNGELWVRQDGSVELKPHAPQSYLRHCLGVEYDPKATCPLYDKVVAEIFSKAPDGSSLTRLWHEVMGYAVQPDRRIALVVIARGEGNDGKTSLIETLVRLVGRDLVTAMPVQNLDQSRFTIGGLLGKLVLLDDDVKTGTRLPDGQLKRLSEAKTVTGEHKFGPPFTFTVRTLPILLCNNPPSLADLSKGMMRRLMVIPFDRSFSDDEVDRDLFPTIWATEMSGVLNRVLAGLGRVIARGWHLDPPESVEKAKNAWLIEANPLPAFIDARCEPKGACWLSHLYNEFLSWALANGITRPQQKSTFKRNLQSSGYVIVHGNKGDKVQGLKPR